MATIEEAKEIIAQADACGQTPLLIGPHGIGKTESGTQYAAEENMHYEPLILSLMDTGDMLGIPENVVIGGSPTTIWSAPDWYTNIVNAAWPNKLKTERLRYNDQEFQKFVLSQYDDHVISRGKLNDLYCEYYELPEDRLQILRQTNVEYLDARRSMLNLDEFNRAHPDILNASLQLILEHRLHSHILPVVRGQETLIVAAVNPSGGDYNVQEFDPALLDRFVECEVEPDFECWRKYATKKGLKKVVIDFLIDNENRFHFTPEDGSKGTSPRTWTRLAHYLEKCEDMNPAAMPLYLKGLLGSSVAAQFLMFYNNYGSGLTSEDIEKALKKEIAATKRAGEELHPETLATSITELIEDVDTVKKMDFAETFIKKYIGKSTAKEAMPMLAYLYALPLENLAAVLKTLQSEDKAQYANLAALDKEFGKKLFLKIVQYRKAT